MECGSIYTSDYQMPETVCVIKAVSYSKKSSAKADSLDFVAVVDAVLCASSLLRAAIRALMPFYITLHLKIIIDLKNV